MGDGLRDKKKFKPTIKSRAAWKNLNLHYIIIKLISSPRGEPSSSWPLLKQTWVRLSVTQIWTRLRVVHRVFRLSVDPNEVRLSVTSFITGIISNLPIYQLTSDEWTDFFFLVSHSSHFYSPSPLLLFPTGYYYGCLLIPGADTRTLHGSALRWTVSVA